MSGLRFRLYLCLQKAVFINSGILNDTELIVLEQKALETIKNLLDPVLTEQEFVFAEQKQEEKGISIVYKNEENLAYSVLYNKKTKQFELRSAALPEDNAAPPWRVLSAWLFDPAQDDIGSAQSIGNDFAETIRGPKRVEALQTAKKRRKKNEENNVDPSFFMNRLANIFPGLREDMIEERSRYGLIRPIAFMEAYVLPKLETLLASEDSSTQQKLAELFNDLYENGDMDVRSLITMILLNGVDKAQVKEKLAPYFSEDMAKGYKAGSKMKGKKVKPEKVKKQSKVVADALKNAQNKR